MTKDHDEYDDNDDFHEASSSYNDHANDGASVSSEDSDRDFHDAAELTDLIAEASSFKASGNAHFAAGRSHAALEDYREGLAVLPEYQPPVKPGKKAKGKGKARLDLGEDLFKDDDSEEDAAPPKKADAAVKSKERIRELQDEDDEKEFVEDSANGKSEEQIEMEQLRSALWCNIAACQLKLSLYKEAVEAATNALQDNPVYVKALQRRAAANEKLSTWTSLTSALEDYETLEKLPDTPKALQPTIRQAKRSIPGLIEQRKQTETAEMLEKLKGLGNSFLGKFGMSTDNFQFVKNEETGGYSMNFTQNPPSKGDQKDTT